MTLKFEQGFYWALFLKIIHLNSHLFYLYFWISFENSEMEKK